MHTAIDRRPCTSSTATASPLIVPLSAAGDPHETGGKAANLARLIALGIAVPEGFVLTERARRLFLDQAGLQPLIDAACGDTASRSSRALRCASETVAAMLQAEPMPSVLTNSLGASWRSLTGGDPDGPRVTSPVIVRSSAAGEDSDTASFAGQLDSVAGVTSARALERAVTRVWASRWSHRALAYEAARRAPLAGMGVIVQRQIPAAVSGVLFTQAPDAPGQMVLEYCSGLGEALVSGAIDPGRVRISRGDFGWTPEAAPHGTADLLAGAQIVALARIGLAIEQAFGVPQDIEWTIDGDGRIWIVQARTITCHMPRARRDVCATAEVVLWSNANVNENFPQPISPLLYSIASTGYYYYFRNLGRAFGISKRRLSAMEPSLRRIIGVHGARMYYNLTSIHGVLRAAPFGDLLTASFNAFVGVEQVAAAREGDTFAAHGTGRVSQACEVAVVAARTTWQYLFLTRRVERFEKRAHDFAARTHPDRLATRSAPALLDDFRSFLEIRCHRWNDAALADAASMVCYGLLQRTLARACPGSDQQALHNTLLKALPDLVSGIPPLKLWDLSRLIRQDADLHRLFDCAPPAVVLDTVAREPQFAAFHAALGQYLEEWGFRCSAELMLTVPSLQEAPASLVSLLKTYAALDGPSPADQVARQAAERDEETRRVLRALRWRPLKRWLPWPTQATVVAIVLRWTQRSIQLRERARLKQALLYSRLRRIALALGERLVAQGRLAAIEDVFFLTAEELDALLAGHAMFPDHVRPLIDLRRGAHAAVAASTPPDTMRLRFGEYFERAGTPQPGAAAAAPGLTGLGACGGSITGRAAVLEDLTDAHRITRGDVLVTRQTDPGWGPVFPLISGLVIERGGMLSHGAIIAREFGIPSVVGVREATRRIQDGALITVDGDRGRVEILEERSSC